MVFLVLQLCPFCLLLQQRARLCFLYSCTLLSHVRCSKPFISSDCWLDLLQCVHACSMGEQRIRPSSLGISHCAEPKKRFASSDLLAVLPSAAWEAVDHPCHRIAVLVYVQFVHQDSHVPLWKIAFQLVSSQCVVVSGAVTLQVHLPLNFGVPVSPILQVVQVSFA